MSWVDGVEAGTVPVSDRGLLYGDGVFETMTCRDGAPRFFDLHWQRLALGCERLRFAAPDRGRVLAELRHAAATQQAAPAVLKLIVTRGSATGRGYAPPTEPLPRRIIERYAWEDDRQAAAAGVLVQFASQSLADSPRLAGLKHLNRLEQVLARAELHGSPAREALMRGSDGRIVCGTASNLFLVRAGALLTPRVDRCGVAGVMRAVVLREAPLHGWSVREAEVMPCDLAGADELFLTNARIGIWPVVALGGWRTDSPGPVTLALQAHLDKLRE